MRSPKFIALVFFYSLNSLWNAFYVGSVNQQLALIIPNDPATVALYNLVYTAIASFASPVCTLL